MRKIFRPYLNLGMECGILPCSSRQLNLDVVLANGQSFRWKKSDDGTFAGIARHHAWKLWRKDDKNVAYQIVAKFVEDNSIKAGDLLAEYFQMNVDVENLYDSWSKLDIHFNKQLVGSPDLLQGIRILKQDIVETLFAFICSANNNIPRISGLVEKLCRFYGTKAVTSENGDDELYDFPTLTQLRDALPGMETKLRESGFGYRAKYIADTVRKLDSELGGMEWLESLQKMPYMEARTALMQLPGVGRKVADCICLMGLQKDHVVPVDTHVFQITVELYNDEVNSLQKQKGKKTLTLGVHEEIGIFYAERFGPYAGWAHSILFSNRLRHFKKNPPTVMAKRATKRKL